MLAAAYAWGRLGYPEKQIRQQTYTEARLWHCLAQCPYVFDYQVPLAASHLDFFCPEALLAVEVDGPEHHERGRRAADAERDGFFAAMGIETLRVANADVLDNPMSVAEWIFEQACRRTEVLPPAHRASPFRGWRPIPPLIPAAPDSAGWPLRNKR